MKSKAVSDTGPILHLTEINFLEALNIFSRVLIPKEVEKELKKNKIKIIPRLNVVLINPKFKDNLKILINRYDLDLGEAEAISLVLQEKVDFFITDDLEARQVAKEFNIQVHGTVGIILRSFREGKINRKLAIEKIKELKTKSSLFITEDLINEVLKSILDFKKK